MSNKYIIICCDYQSFKQTEFNQVNFIYIILYVLFVYKNELLLHYIEIKIKEYLFYDNYYIVLYNNIKLRMTILFLHLGS